MKNEERKRNVRSQAYQFLLVETKVPTELMESFQNGDSIQARLNPWEYNEDLLELEDQLKKEFWRLVETHLTERQKEVMRMLADGYTQMEVAKKLGISQSTTQKAVFGSGKGGDKFLGGSKKKLNSVIDDDEKIVELLKKIKDLREERW